MTGIGRVRHVYSHITRFSCVRSFNTSKRLQTSSVDANFESAKQRLNTLSDEPGNETKLKIYALFKQATVGKNTTSKPSVLNFVGQVKWSAWADLGDISQDEAKQAYIDLVNDLAEAVSDSGSSVDGDHGSGDVKEYCSGDILTKIENKIMTITLNRPKKFNALTREMYGAYADILNDAAEDNNVSIVALTGAGQFFCSGNDLTVFSQISPAEMRQATLDGAVLLKRYVASMIDFPKPLIALINGPVIGIPVTQLGLFDGAFATDKATFQTPFSKTGQSPEGCASYTFPKIMGHSRACSMLLFNEKIDATEAAKLNLITKVFPDSTFKDDVQQELEEMAQLPVKSLVYSKRLMRNCEIDILHKINEQECERLSERWISDDCVNAMMKFLTKS